MFGSKFKNVARASAMSRSGCRLGSRRLHITVPVRNPVRYGGIKRFGGVTGAMNRIGNNVMAIQAIGSMCVGGQTRLFSDDGSKEPLQVCEKGGRATVHLTITAPDGTVVVDTEKQDSPVSFVVGQGQVLPGIDSRMVGMKVGDEWEKTLTPKETFGEYVEERIFSIPAPTDENVPLPDVGARVSLTNGEIATVIETSKEKIVVDTNHQLAGKSCSFKVKLLQVEELEERDFNGVEVESIHAGDGKTYAKAGDTIRVHYVGTLANGKVFDSSRNSQPLEFKLGVGRVIRGWDEGLTKVSLGERAKLYIASEFAYGAQGAGDVIPPHANLIFDVEIMQIGDQKA
mmetsp:Transcript_5820/g.9048  ORF Transcript_5820/g.9048 Transcript_5820/m.9048 type:complete len:343 (-) Transcript_5820:1040-2068(-)